MQNRIDPLIAERAAWLFADSPLAAVPRRALMQLLRYNETVSLARSLDHLAADQMMQTLSTLLPHDVAVSGLDNIPRHGPALIVANHPTGIADGIILHYLIAPLRPDLYFYANSDILRVFPQIQAMIAPVEWRKEKRSHTKTRATMAYTQAAVRAGRIGVIFASGRLAKRRGLRLHERPWMASPAMLAPKFDLPVIPVNIRARNSVLFYLSDLIHPSLRNITLFHETLNKAQQPYSVTIGEAVSPTALPARFADGIKMLRRATLALGGRHAPAVSLLDSTRRPGWAKALRPVG